jgi:hypothetical protein
MQMAYFPDPSHQSEGMGKNRKNRLQIKMRPAGKPAEPHLKTDCRRN